MFSKTRFLFSLLLFIFVTLFFNSCSAPPDLRGKRPAFFPIESTAASFEYTRYYFRGPIPPCDPDPPDSVAYSYNIETNKGQLFEANVVSFTGGNRGSYSVRSTLTAIGPLPKSLLPRGPIPPCIPPDIIQFNEAFLKFYWPVFETFTAGIIDLPISKLVGIDKVSYKNREFDALTKVSLDLKNRTIIHETIITPSRATTRK